MNKQYDNGDQLRKKIIGLGKNSIRKNYFSELKLKKEELEIQNKNLQEEVDRRREAELKLIDLNHKLESLVDERTLDLERTNRYLEESMAELRDTQDYLIKSEKISALSHVIRGLAHEVNTPLGACITSASYIEKLLINLVSQLDKNSITKKDFNSYIEKLMSANSLLNKGLGKTVTLMENLKTLTIENKFYEKSLFNVFEVISFICKGYEHEITEKNITLKIMCEKTINIMSYPGIIKLIISSFMINSINHAFTNRSSGEIDIMFELEDDIFKMNFKDNGIGIPEEMEIRIFDPYFTTTFGQGTSGMGLFAVYGMVKNQLKGDIELINKNGLEYQIWFPRS